MEGRKMEEQMEGGKVEGRDRLVSVQMLGHMEGWAEEETDDSMGRRMDGWMNLFPFTA